MIERVIANWLTNVNEMGYTLPFCEVLVSEGHSILHVARGGPGEHGKDIVTRGPDARLHSFQLKGGDITLPKWRDIRGEVEELVRLPVHLPGISKTEPHVPCLVTNGELVGDAVTSVDEFANLWVNAGSPRLEVLVGGQLLRRFIDAHGSYLPTPLKDFRRFVELFVATYEDVLPREQLAVFLESLVAKDRIRDKATDRKRAVESMALVGSYLVEGYERAENHVAAAMGWTIIASVIMHFAERESLTRAVYVSTLELAWQGFDRALTRLEEEVLGRRDLIEPHLAIVEPMVYGSRVLMVLGWLAAGQHVPERPRRADSKRILAVFQGELRNLRFLGEGDWPYVMASALLLGRAGSSVLAERMVERWMDVVIAACRREEAPGLPSPYWLPEEIMALRGGFLPRHEEEAFGRNTYTLMSAADMLVRRMRRMRITASWPEMSKLTFCDFAPREPQDWFLWKSPTGDIVFEHPSEERSWSAWRRETEVCKQSVLPATLLADPKWVLPFALTYPHRANRALCGMIDALIGQVATLA